MIRSTVLAVVATAALVVTGSAFAHAQVSPSVVPANDSEVFTLAVPTEKDDATTTKIEMTPPAGFSIDSFVGAPGWKRAVQQMGSGEDATITKVTWTGGNVPTGEATGFEFLGRADSAKTYTFNVRQTYSDGSVVDWAGAEDSDAPAPSISAKSSLGGGGSSTLGIVAIVLAALALVVGLGGLVVGRSVRPLA
jgi:uncharacterized protein YcnI